MEMQVAGRLARMPAARYYRWETDVKTNAVRILESLGIEFEIATYAVGDEHLDAVEVARGMGVDPDTVFKTLVAHDETNAVLVFCVPGSAELDLKKAARAAGVRKIDLISLKDLTPITGYVRGGCSPVGMKKRFPTWIDEIAHAWPRIYVNAGARGMQVRVAPADLASATGAVFADLV
jgi:Cys-tRNA(Pro)/Cys-tRNA(Cys) deacylase